MGLGEVKETGLFLTLAGGFIWNRKADKSDPNYGEQQYEWNKEVKTRTGAKYADLTGMITKVVFREHKEFGENLNVYFKAGEESYIISIGLSSRYCDHMLKALLVADLTKPIFMKPYDFVPKDGKRKEGISFRQDGEKLDLRVDISGDLERDSDWFKTASKKEIIRFFEDLTDHYKERVIEEICPTLEGSSDEGEQEEDEEQDEKPKAKASKTTSKKKDEPKKVAPLAMRRFLKEYIEENYPDKEMPSLKGADLKEWYDLAQQLEELPFEDEKEDEDTEEEIESDDLEAELNKLL